MRFHSNLTYLEHEGKLRKLDLNTPHHGLGYTESLSKSSNLQSLQIHLLHLMRSYSSLKAIWGLGYTCFRVFGSNEAIWVNCAQIPQMMGWDTQKIIQGLQVFNSYQMRPYSSVRTIQVSRYTSFWVSGH